MTVGALRLWCFTQPFLRLEAFDLLQAKPLTRWFSLKTSTHNCDRLFSRLFAVRPAQSYTRPSCSPDLTIVQLRTRAQTDSILLIWTVVVAQCSVLFAQL